MKSHHFLTFLTVLFCLSFLGTVYLIFFDGKYVRKPTTIENAKSLITDKSEYKQGEIVRVYMNICKNRTVPGVGIWQMTNGTWEGQVKKEGSLSKGCHNIWVDVMEVPQSVEDGKVLHLEATLTYPANIITDTTIELRTQDFLII